MYQTDDPEILVLLYDDSQGAVSTSSSGRSQRNELCRLLLMATKCLLADKAQDMCGQTVMHFLVTSQAAVHGKNSWFKSKIGS